MSKTKKVETERVFLYLPKEMFLQVADMACHDQRSLNRQVVWMIGEFLKQENQKKLDAARNNAQER